MMLAKAAFAYCCLILPGYFTAKILRSRTPWSAAVPFSILILFFGVFLLNSLGVHLTFTAVAAWEFGAFVLLGVMLFFKRHVIGMDAALHGTSNRNSVVFYPLIAGTTLVCLVAAYTSVMVPLSGADIQFRWEFLAKQIMRYKTLDFYPPVTPADFQIYFYPDGFAPVVSICYWWIYAAIGKSLSVAVMPLVLLQFFSLLGFAFHLSERLNSRFAGWLSCGILASSPLFFRAVMIGQETGLTALAMVGSMSALVDANEREDKQSFILAALFAGLGGLTREYGVALAGGALLLIGWRRMGWRGVFIFISVALLLLAPWHMRNWLRCGNPLYIHSLGIFPVNPVYAALMGKFKEVFGLQNFGMLEWKELFLFLLKDGFLPLLIGIPMAFRHLRQNGWLILSIALSISLWLLSIGYTNGGLVYSMRVLSPALVLASVMAAINLAYLSRNSMRRQWLFVVVIASSTLYGALFAAIFPDNFSKLKSPSLLLDIMTTQYVNPTIDTRIIYQLSTVYPPGSRILSDNPYAHSQLANNGSKYTLVPIWSPEVKFLFDAQVSPLEQRRMLIEKGISGAIYDPQIVNSQFTFEASPFYKFDSPNWQVVSEGDDSRRLAKFVWE